MRKLGTRVNRMSVLQYQPRGRSYFQGAENRPGPAPHLSQNRRCLNGTPAPGFAGILGGKHSKAPVKEKKAFTAVGARLSYQ